MSNTVLVLAIATAACFATLAGGVVALRLRDKLHLLLAFSAGAVIAVALFDLLPESLVLGTDYSPSTILGVTGIGFFAYTVLDRLIVLHTHLDDEHDESHIHHEVSRAWLGAGSLSGHSLIDGLAIGLAFKVSPIVGGVVAMAVLVHDCSDGMNTVNMVLRSGGTPRQAFGWLVTDAVAPIIGAFASLFFSLSNGALALALSLFAGFFLFIGASDLLPESHHSHPKFLTTLATLLGAASLYLVIRLGG